MSYTKFNFFFMILAAFFAFFLQVSVWPMSFLSPQLLIPFLVFFSGFRKPFEAVFFIYALACLSSFFTALTFGALLCTLSLLFVLNLILNDRFFKKDINYFSVSCFLNTFLMGVFISYFSSLHFSFINWILSSTFTYFISFCFYIFFLWLDEKTQKDDITSEGAFL